MNRTSDPLADATADGITFEPEQTSWITHHIRNALMGVIHGDAEQKERSVKRLLSIAHAAEEQQRPLEPHKRCIVCDEKAELGPGYVCQGCSDEA